MLFPKRSLIVFLCSILFIVLIVFLSFQSATYTVRSATTDVSKLPLMVSAFLSHEVKSIFLFHKSYWDNLKLERENESLRSRILRDQILLVENDRLRKLLELKTQASYGTQAARVIGIDINSFRPYLILDRGTSSGIKKYAAVMAPLGLVGKIIELGRYTSKVVAVNDPDLSIPAVNNRNREHGLVSGSLDGRCKFRFLDIDSDIKNGDQILTSGLNGTYPEGILIGIVKFVGIESSGMGKFAILEPSAQVAGIDEVLIAK